MKVITDAINPLLLNAAFATWPDKSWRGWHHYMGRDSEKYGTKSHHDIPPAAMACIMEMVAVASRECVSVFPDLELHGAGMHMIQPYGYLRRHLDSSVMESTGWKREYSCVLSVNPEWRDKWGGEFILNGCKPVYPAFNQMILFRTTDESFHEVNQVVGPEPRCTLAVFFWSKSPVGLKPRLQAQFTGR